MNTYTTIERPTTLITGIKCRTSNDPKAGPIDISKLWEEFFSRNIINQIPNKTSSDVFALYCEYEGDYTMPYSLIIGCPVNSKETTPDGLITKSIPAGSYALFIATGEHPKSVIETWQTIWGTNLKRSYTGDFELYGNKFSNNPQEVEVYIALQNHFSN